MKTLEQGSNKFTTWLGNITALPTQLIVPIFTISLFYKVNEWVFDKNFSMTRLLPQWKVGHIGIGNTDNQSLFYNSGFYFRFMLPFWLGVQIRWRGDDISQKEVLCMGIGWKLNGRLAALFRVQSDASAEEGVQGVNLGQAKGWDFGPR